VRAAGPDRKNRDVIRPARAHKSFGAHSGAGTAKDADPGFQKIRATVAPAPYDAYAATQYRRH
jgi:hypothetical protein